MASRIQIPPDPEQAGRLLPGGVGVGNTRAKGSAFGVGDGVSVPPARVGGRGEGFLFSSREQAHGDPIHLGNIALSGQTS
jgi:hypothetical protein